MTDRITALRALEKAVEAGCVGAGLNTASVFGDNQTAMDAVDAFYGSWDAAKSVQDAELPGWVGSVDTDGFARIFRPGPVITVMETVRLDGMTSRAWLLAIIRAIIAQEGGE